MQGDGVAIVTDPRMELFFTSSVTPKGLLMRTILLGLLAVAGIAIAPPLVSPASAQVNIETPQAM
jgi:hypothetical protein